MGSGYRWWKSEFDALLRGLKPKEVDESIDWDLTALRFVQSEEDIVAESAEKVRNHLKQHAPTQLKTQLITISIDKNLEPVDAVKVQYEVYDAIAGAEYKFLDNATATFEYHTDKGFNPHIHIMTHKVKSDGQVAQQIRRKFKNNDKVYRVHVSTLNYQQHSAYMNGDKQEAKQEYVRKDEVFREIHNINNIFKF